MLLRGFRLNLKFFKSCRDLRVFSTETSSSPQVNEANHQTADDGLVSNDRETTQVDKQVTNNRSQKGSSEKSFRELAEYRFVYPEFLPTSKYEWQNKIREKLERADMLKRRMVIDIPEFYSGSILAVTCADPYAPGKENRFVGICIARTHNGLRATFTLRNIVDHQGVEIMYDLYNPTIRKIEVLRLEKRLDDELYYLRDALPEFSTFPFDMEPEYRIAGEPVKVNPLKVKLKPRPWDRRWELRNLKGVEPFEIPPWNAKMVEKNAAPWEAYDLMKQYRLCIPEEEQKEIWEEVNSYQQQFQLKKKKLKWKQRALQRAPKKT